MWQIYALLNEAIIGSDNVMSPVWRQATIWTNAGILLISHGKQISMKFSSKYNNVFFEKMRLKMSSGKWRPFCLGLSMSRVPQGFFDNVLHKL